MSDLKQTAFTDAKKKQAESEKDRDLRLMREKQDLLEILKMPEGRRLLWRLMDRGSIDGFNGNSSEMYFFTGRRKTAVELRNEIMDANLESYILMIRENNGDKK